MLVTHNTASHMWTWQRDGSRCFQYTGRERTTCRAQLFHGRMRARTDVLDSGCVSQTRDAVNGMWGLVTALVWLLKTRKEVLKFNADKSVWLRSMWTSRQNWYSTWFPPEVICSHRDIHTHPNMTFTIFWKTWFFYIISPSKKLPDRTFVPFCFLLAK